MILETILGGVTGLIGNVVGGIFKYKHAKLQKEMQMMGNTHEINMVREETKAMIEETKANIKITQAQVEGAIDIKDSDAYMESLKQGNKSTFSNKWVDNLLNIEGHLFSWGDKHFLSWKLLTVPIASFVALLFGIVDFIKAMIRPSLTLYLCGVTTWVTMLAWEVMQSSGTGITPMEALNLFKDTTSIVVYLTVSCVTWWFGDRRMAKTIMEVKGGADRTKMDDNIVI